MDNRNVLAALTRARAELRARWRAWGAIALRAMARHQWFLCSDPPKIVNYGALGTTPALLGAGLASGAVIAPRTHADRVGPTPPV